MPDVKKREQKASSQPVPTRECSPHQCHRPGSGLPLQGMPAQLLSQHRHPMPGRQLCSQARGLQKCVSRTASSHLDTKRGGGGRIKRRSCLPSTCSAELSLNRLVRSPGSLQEQVSSRDGRDCICTSVLSLISATSTVPEC